MISKGDGTMARLMRYGLCPKCETISKGNMCVVCGLEIVERPDGQVRTGNGRIASWLAQRPHDGLARG